MTDEQLQELKAKHPGTRMHHLRAEDGTEVVLRPPTRMEFREWQSKMAGDPPRRAEYTEQLFLTCLVYPERQAFIAELEQRPGLVASLAESLMELAGAGLRIEKKVL